MGVYATALEPRNVCFHVLFAVRCGSHFHSKQEIRITSCPTKPHLSEFTCRVGAHRVWAIQRWRKFIGLEGNENPSAANPCAAVPAKSFSAFEKG